MAQKCNKNDDNNSNNNYTNGNDNSNGNQLASILNPTSESSNTAFGGDARRSFLYPFRIEQINHKNNSDYEEASKNKFLLKDPIDHLYMTRKIHQSKPSLENQFYIFENGSTITSNIFILYIESVVELLKEAIVNK